MSLKNSPFLLKKLLNHKLNILLEWLKTGGLDPRKTVISEWLDDINLWSIVTCVHVVM